MSPKNKKMNSRRKCWVPTCKNSADQGFDKKFFFLPAKSQTRELWIAVSGKPTESIPPEEIVFCEEHFSAQDAIKIDTNSYINSMVLVPSRNMPDRTCRTCMSIIPFDQSFHIMSSKFPSEMPSSIKDVLCFWISSKPEPLHHIFTFCMPELKIPRDPCQLVCNDCFHNIWLFFVYKVTCIEVEKDLKGDMSWENYGKKVLCRSCIQTSGTNFIPLSPQSNIGSLLQKMFVNDCPSSETVPLQVCLICFNVLEKLDHFYKNCHEVEEKMKRHIALKNKYNQSSIKQLPSSSVYKSNISTNIDETVTEGSVKNKFDTEFFCVQNISGSQTTNPNISQNCAVGTSSRDKLTLAMLMSKHGHSLKSDLYQQEIWSLICQKMQKQGICCTVPGLINVWKGMMKETKRKFDMSEPTGYLDELMMEFYKKEPESTEAGRSINLRSSVGSKSSATLSADTISLSSLSTETSTSSHNQIDLVLKERDNDRKKSGIAKKICDENKPKKVIATEKRTSFIATSKSDQTSPSSLQKWSEEMKLNFIKAFKNEYNSHVTQRNSSKISMKKGPWRTICMRLADNSDYKTHDGIFLYRIWTSMKNKAEREKGQVDISLGSKIVLALLHKESLVYQTRLSGKKTKTDEHSPLTLSKRIDGRLSNKDRTTPKTSVELEKKEKLSSPLTLSKKIDGRLVNKDRTTPKTSVELEKKEKLRQEFPLSNQVKQNKTINGPRRGRPKSTVPLAEKRAFLKAIVSEYDACKDHEKACKTPWKIIIKRVVKKLPTWNFEKAYGYWSRWKISALTHEKGSSDVFDNEVWKLLERQEAFKKNYVNNCPQKDTGSSSGIKEKNQTMLLPNGNRNSNKRPSNETLSALDKKQRSLLTLISEEEKLGLVELLKKTYNQMYKEQPSSVYWSAVIKRIFEKGGGFKDFTLEEVDTIWNRLIFNASKSKHDGTLTILDKEIHKLVSHASEIQTDSESLLLIKDVKNLKDERTSRLLENDGPRRSNNSNCLKLSTTDSSVEDESFSRRNWFKDEKRALLYAIIKQGDKALKYGPDDKWDNIYKEFTDKGYNRSIAAVKSNWYHMRTHAENMWAKRKAGNELDQIINSFIHGCSSPIENAETAVLESGMIQDSLQKFEEKGEDELAQSVDLTYNYVSFEDIEKLSEEPMFDKSSIKTEYSIKAEGNEKDHHESIEQFLLAKVEGRVQFDNEEPNQSNEASCAEESLFEKSTIADEKDASDDFISENGVLDGNKPENNVETNRNIMSEVNIKSENVWKMINQLEKSSTTENSVADDIIELLDSDEG